MTFGHQNHRSQASKEDTNNYHDSMKIHKESSKYQISDSNKFFDKLPPQVVEPSSSNHHTWRRYPWPATCISSRTQGVNRSILFHHAWMPSLKPSYDLNDYIAPHISSIWPTFEWKKLKLMEGEGCKLTIFAKFRRSISTIANFGCKWTIISKFRECFGNYAFFFI
jgi:hypothetical protein